jgi:hypothetical protein
MLPPLLLRSEKIIGVNGKIRDAFHVLGNPGYKATKCNPDAA